MTVDKELLFKPRLPEVDVEVPGLGTFRVRALSRAEVVDDLNKSASSVPYESRLVAMSLVEPQMTEDEVQRWREVSQPHEIETVTGAINDITALSNESAKAAYKEFEADSDATFRALPSGEAGDDGGPDASGDAQ